MMSSGVTFCLLATFVVASTATEIHIADLQDGQLIGHSYKQHHYDQGSSKQKSQDKDESFSYDFREYLGQSLESSACKIGQGCQRRDRLNNTYLSFCSRYKLESLLSNDILNSIVHDSSESCDKILNEFNQLDQLIEKFDRLFKNLLSRYNCHNGYSVKWGCDDCKVSLSTSDDERGGEKKLLS